MLLAGEGKNAGQGSVVLTLSKSGNLAVFLMDVCTHGSVQGALLMLDHVCDVGKRDTPLFCSICVHHSPQTMGTHTPDIHGTASLDQNATGNLSRSWLPPCLTLLQVAIFPTNQLYQKLSTVLFCNVRFSQGSLISHDHPSFLISTASTKPACCPRALQLIARSWVMPPTVGCCATARGSSPHSGFVQGRGKERLG